MADDDRADYEAGRLVRDVATLVIVPTAVAALLGPVAAAVTAVKIAYDEISDKQQRDRDWEE